jgi:hypothetical protein
MSCQIIEIHREVGRVERLCRALGVSVSGYYATKTGQDQFIQDADDLK